MDLFTTELSKVQCKVLQFTVAGMGLFSLQLPLGGIVIIEPTVKGKKRNNDQESIKLAFESAGIKWKCFQSPVMARRAADGIVNCDRTRAEVLKLAKEYTQAACFFESHDIDEKNVPSFDEEDNALREMVHFMNRNDAAATTFQQDTDH